MLVKLNNVYLYYPCDIVEPLTPFKLFIGENLPDRLSVSDLPVREISMLNIMVSTSDIYRCSRCLYARHYQANVYLMGHGILVTISEYI